MAPSARPSRAGWSSREGRRGRSAVAAGPRRNLGDRPGDDAPSCPGAHAAGGARGAGLAKAEPAADELRQLGAREVEVVPFDALDTSSHQALVDAVFGRDGDIDCALLAFGVLGDQERLAHDPAAAAEAVQTNFTGAVSVGIAVAERMKRQG